MFFFYFFLVKVKSPKFPDLAETRALIPETHANALIPAGMPVFTKKEAEYKHARASHSQT